MSKQSFFLRYTYILDKLKQKPYSSFEEIEDYIKKKSEFLHKEGDDIFLGFCKRTFQKDKKEIEKIYKIEINFSKQKGAYFISEEGSADNYFQRISEQANVLNLLNHAKEFQSIIFFENQKPIGTENMFGFIHAIKNKLQIKFSYQKFYETTSLSKIVEPYAIKEFKQRWYLIATDINDGYLKTFGLDRLTNLETTTKKFKPKKEINTEQLFAHSYGIFYLENQEPQEVVLSFDIEQGKYIKSLPLHKSQKIIYDNEEVLIIKLIIHLTYDFVKELISFGDSMLVVKPKSLAKQVKDEHKKAFDRYKLI
jgi:hypothetical protein